MTAREAEAPLPEGAGPAEAGEAGTDAVLAARARASGEFLAGLIAAAELDTVGTPRLLPHDLFPDYDPEVVRAVWERALVVGVRAGQLMARPRFYRDKLSRLQGELEEVGFAAMGRTVCGPLSAVARYPELHVVDDEAARGH